MAKQNGALIKETRKAVGMSQEALSKASGVSVKDISKVERGIEDLAPEKLEAVAKALDVTPESLLLPEKPLTDDEKELLELYRSADADTQKAATSALKGEAPKSQDPMSAMMGMFGGMMGGAAGGEGAAAGAEGGAAGAEGGTAGADPMSAMMGMFGGMMGGAAGGEGGDAGSNPMAAMMGMFGGMMGGAAGGEGAAAGAEAVGGEEQKEAPAEEKKEE